MNVTKSNITHFLSTPRFNVYLSKTNNDFEKAFKLYQTNLELSEAFYPILSILEVSLRNAINQRLNTHFNNDEWFKNNLPPEFSSMVSTAIQKLQLQKKNITPDRIIAELNFGFWNRLFNKNSSQELWKPLRLVFKNIPKQLKKRETISNSLYRIRTLRNRIYHYEPIFENLNDLEKLHNEMLEFLNWIDSEIPLIITEIDRFNAMVTKAKIQKTEDFQ